MYTLIYKIYMHKQIRVKNHMEVSIVIIKFSDFYWLIVFLWLAGEMAKVNCGIGIVRAKILTYFR